MSHQAWPLPWLGMCLGFAAFLYGFPLATMGDIRMAIIAISGIAVFLIQASLFAEWYHNWWNDI